MRFALLLSFCLFALAAARTVDRKKNYRGFQVLRVKVANELQARALLKLETAEGLDFWTEPRVGGFADIMVPPTRVDLFSKLTRMGLDFETMIEDLGVLVEEERADMASRQGKITHTSYHTLEEIYAFFDEQVAANSADVSVVSIGESYEGQDMRVIQICRGGCGSKPGMWIQAGIHAREWISPATATYMVDQLINNPEFSHLVDGLDWYILPSVNPDGYMYTWDSDRMWRKTRSPNNSPLDCVGTDANRNYDFHWNEGGTSDSMCSDTYHGTQAFSEIENQHVRDFIGRKPAKYFQFFQDLHSYSQLVLLPFGYTGSVPADYDELLEAFNKANAALFATSGMRYTVGNTYDTIYPASGIAVDWGYGAAGIKYSVSVELRDTGTFGFVLPPGQIIPTGEEMMAFHASIGETIIAENAGKKL